jgi:hypothetical protein
MNTQIQLFTFKDEDHFSKVRTVEIDGQPWFVAVDVAKALGYSNSRDAVLRHCKPRGVVKHDIPTSSSVQSFSLINEGNLYRLVSKSKLETAERFEEWVFDEVIPTIRKKGSYGINRLETPDFIKRYLGNAHKIPLGFFCVITATYVSLYARLEHLGYKIPNRGHMGKEIRVDVSVGQMFSKYLKENFPSVQREFQTYKHAFESGFEVDARLYPNSLMGLFLDFMELYWIPQHAEKYFYERDRLALDYLPKLLN